MNCCCLKLRNVLLNDVLLISNETQKTNALRHDKDL